MNTPFLPYGRQSLDEDDVAAVVEILRSEQLTAGLAVDAFEGAFAAATGASHAVACSSGTAALHLAALGLGLGPGDAVVVPAVTFLATANAVRHTGAEVVFADVDPETGLLDEASLGAALDRGVDSLKAVYPVHLGGQCVDMEMVARLAGERGLAVVEDASHALGGGYITAESGEVPVGSCGYGKMAIFSCHPVKAIAMGEGGVVTTNDSELAAGLKRFRNHGMEHDPERWHNGELGFADDGGANPWYYEMTAPGFNYRVSDVHCALGLSQLGKLKRFITRRRELAALYDTALASLAPTVTPAPRAAGCNPAWHLYMVRVDFDALGMDRARLMARLEEAGIGTQVHYIPLHRQPYYETRYDSPDLPGADAFYAGVLSLPLFPAMTDDDVTRVAEAMARQLP